MLSKITLKCAILSRSTTRTYYANDKTYGKYPVGHLPYWMILGLYTNTYINMCVNVCDCICVNYLCLIFYKIKYIYLIRFF